jgi:hypothetical protein
VNAPADLVLAGSGIEIGSSVGNDRQERIYIGGPQRDFYLAASSRYESASRKVGETRLTAYFPREYHNSGMMVLKTAQQALESYNERFGTYPYTELNLISTPMNAGGMEYSTAVALSLKYFDSSDKTDNLSFLESVVAHEVAHQWFFNQVMSDQINEPWLDESVTQYATCLYYLDRYGESGAEGCERSWYERWNDIQNAAIPIGKSAGAYTATSTAPSFTVAGRYSWLRWINRSVMRPSTLSCAITWLDTAGASRMVRNSKIWRSRPVTAIYPLRSTDGLGNEELPDFTNSSIGL